MVFAQLQPLKLIQLLYELLVKCTCKAGSVRHGERNGAAVHPDAARPIRAAADRNSERLQLFRHAAERSRRSRRHLRGTHPFSAHKTAQILIGKLRDKILHSSPAFRHINQTKASVTGIRGFCRPPGRNPFVQRDGSKRRFFICDSIPILRPLRLHSSERFIRRHGLGQLPHRSGLLDYEASGGLRASYVRSHIEGILSGLENIAGSVSGHAGIIIGRKIIFRAFNRHHTALSRLKQIGLCEPRKTADGLAELSLRRLAIYLYNLFPGHLSGIGNAHPQTDGPLSSLQSRLINQKCRVGKAEAKRIQHLILRKGLKIPVSDIDILLIAIARLTAVISRGRIIRNVICYGIGKLAGRGYAAGQNIHGPSSALLSALPDIQHCPRMIPADPFHIDNIAGIQKHYGFLKHGAHQPDHILLRICQQITASFCFVILILARGTPDKDQGGIRFFGCFLHQPGRKRHLLLEPRLGCPPISLIKRMLLKPFLIRRPDCLIDMNCLLATERLRDVYDMPRINQSARSGSAFKVIELAPSK